MKLTSLLKTSIALAATTLAATTLAAAPAFAQSANWTGAYLGGEAGGANLKISGFGASVDDDSLIGGIIAGYDYDLGTWVIGAGADFDFTDVDFGGANFLESVWRLKLRGGYKIGNGLLYATGGYTSAQLATASDQDGYFIGGGFDYKFQPNISLGGEVLYTRFDNMAGFPIDGELITYQLRAAYRF
ncbi:outer membrane protein, putative [hydrothermal vent metagenome]|uniref:Outer membrane protein, putative n=1 Tax=hydrothermal vent metagenome TaxID=652676 RepID=A0A3B0S725_9ZZZZ